MATSLSMDLVGKASLQLDSKSFSMTALSSDGKYVFAIPVIVNNTSPPPMAGVIYNVVDGQLKEMCRIPIDPEYSWPIWGAASDDFTVLSILEGDSEKRARLRIYNINDLTGTPKIISIPDEIITKLASQGKVVLKNRYLSVTYLTLEGSSSILSVYDLVDGSEVLRIPYQGYASSGGFLFEFRKKNYLAFGYAGATRDANGFNYKAPANLEIYGLETKCKVISIPVPTLITDMSIPKFDSSCKEIPLAVSFIQTDLPDALSLYNVPLFNYTGEKAGIRIYYFNGRKLQLIGDQPQTNDIISIEFDPSGRYLAAIIKGGFLDTLVIYRTKHLYEKDRFRFEFRHLENVPAVAYSLNYSQDGKYLLISGAYIKTSGIADIALYSICH